MPRLPVAVATVLCAVAGLVPAAPARADAFEPPAGHVLTGLSGGLSLSPFAGQVASRPATARRSRSRRSASPAAGATATCGA
jgi:hypothetical protein